MKHQFYEVFDDEQDDNYKYLPPVKNYLVVEYSQRHVAKNCGAKWDKEKKKWYTHDDVDTFYDAFTGKEKHYRYKETLTEILFFVENNGTTPDPVYVAHLKEKLQKME